MADKLLVLAVTRYGFKADDGKWLEGSKLQVLERDSKVDADRIGNKVVILSGDRAVFDQFQGKTLPAYFDVDYTVESGAQGAPKVKVSAATFLHGWMDKAPSPVRAAA